MKTIPLSHLLLIATFALVAHVHAAPVASISADKDSMFTVPFIEGKPKWSVLPPAGVVVNNWSEEGEGEIALKEFEGELAFVVTNTGAKTSCFLVLKEPFLDAELVAGKTYEVAITYMIQGNPSPVVRLSLRNPEGVVDADGEYPLVDKKKIPTNVILEAPLDEVTSWETLKLKLKVTGGPAKLEVELHTSNSGEDFSAGIRSIEVTETAAR